MTQALMLKNRGLLRLTGTECRPFLQGLITTDMKNLTPDTPIYAGFLTPQGKYLFDFILFETETCLYLDCELERAEQLCQRLTMFKLRADVTIENLSDQMRIWVIWGDGDLPYPTFTDPRHWKMGRRAIVTKGINLTLPEDDTAPACTPLKLEEYEVERISLGIPDGSRDMKVDKYFWLECRAEAIGGVNFDKGCYIGQEQTARMKHRTTLKKSLIPVKFTTDTALPALTEGAEIKTTDGKNAGEIRTTARDMAMAYLRLAQLDKDLICDGYTITPLEQAP